MEKENNLIYNIGKKEYLLMDVLLGYNGEKEKKAHEMGAISQGIKEMKSSGLFNCGHTIVSFLVPIDKIKEFQDKVQ